MASKKNNDVSISMGFNPDAKGIEEAVKILGNGTAQMEKRAEAMSKKITANLGDIGSGPAMKTTLRQLEKLAGQMQMAGLEGTKAFSDIIAKTGKLKAEQQDLKDLIDASRPDAPFKALSNTLGAAAQGFAGVQGAMALFGAESEDTQKLLLKVQAAMAFTQAFDAIDGLQDGFKQLNAVIARNPLIAGAAALAAAGAVIYAMSRSVDAATKAQERLNKVNDIAYDNTIDQQVELNQLKKVIDSNTSSEEEKLKAEQKLIDKFPEYYGNLVAGKNGHDDFSDAIDAHVLSLLNLAKAEAAQQLYIEKLKEINDLKAKAKAESSGDILSLPGFVPGMLPYAMQLSNAKDEAIALEAELNKLNKIAAETTPNKPKTPPAGGSGGVAKSKGIVGSPFTKGLEGIGTAFAVAKGNARREEAEAEKKDIEDKKEFFANDLTGRLAIQKHYNKKALELSEQKAAEELKLAEEEAKKQAAIQTEKQNQINSINQSIEGSVENMISALASAIGEGGDPMAAFLTVFADGLESLGKLLIAQGIAFAALAASIDPFTKVAAGAAAVLAGAAIKAQLKQNAAKGFADGGLIGGNSFTGDRLLAPVNSGEVVFNEGKQNGFMRAMDSFIGGGGGGQLVAKVSGKDLLFVLDRTKGGFNRG